MGKPVRAVRRFIRRKGKGKGKGKGKSGKAGASSAFLSTLSDDEVEHIFIGKGKGKGGSKGKRSSGKRQGTKGEPFWP